MGGEAVTREIESVADIRRGVVGERERPVATPQFKCHLHEP
jgi:hypothetical protein